MKRPLFLLMLLITLTNAFSQRYWTLDECVNTAMKNNISLRQKNLTRRSADADVFQSKMNVLPSVNGQMSNNWNTGFAINPITNSAQRDVTFRSNNFSLNANMTLFNGFQNTNSIRLNESNKEATAHDVQSTMNTIALSICNAYLLSLQNIELVESRRLQTESTKSLVMRQEKMYELGASNKTKLLQLKAQLSNEELLLVTAENQLAQSYLTLWQAMNIAPDSLNRIRSPEPGPSQVDSEIRTAEQVYEVYTQNSPEIKAAKQRRRSAEISGFIAQGGRSPRLTLTGNINSFYSTQSQKFTGSAQNILFPTGIVDSAGNSLSYYTLARKYSNTEVVPFSEQFDKNLGKTIGLSLTLPIFNGWQVNSNIKKQNINLENAELNEAQARNDVYKNVYQSYLDFKSAKKKYEANVNNLDANKEAAVLAEGQFNLGALSTNDYLQAKNANLQAETNFLQAKYELLFRRKVLDFYLGKSLY